MCIIRLCTIARLRRTMSIFVITALNYYCQLTQKNKLADNAALARSAGYDHVCT